MELILLFKYVFLIDQRAVAVFFGNRIGISNIGGGIVDRNLYRHFFRFDIVTLMI